jgi:hypothetical protein
MEKRLKVGGLSIVRSGVPPYRAEQRGSLWYVADKDGQNVLQIQDSLTKFLPREAEIRRIAEAMNESDGTN